MRVPLRSYTEVNGQALAHPLISSSSAMAAFSLLPKEVRMATKRSTGTMTKVKSAVKKAANSVVKPVSKALGLGKKKPAKKASSSKKTTAKKTGAKKTTARGR